MTLVVGIRCTDGIVVASDSAVTFSLADGAPTISDRYKKIRAIKDKIIVAGTGQVGMGQRFCAIVEKAWNLNVFTNAKAIDICASLGEMAYKEFQRTGCKRNGYGALVAFPSDQGMELCEFSTDGFQPELKTNTLWYASMGSGQTLGDPYLRLMRHVFWQDGPPTLEEGRFAAMWVMIHSIEAAPGFIGGDISMATLEKDGINIRASMLAEDRLQEHKDLVQASTGHFRDFRRMKSTANAPDLPKL